MISANASSASVPVDACEPERGPANPIPEKPSGRNRNGTFKKGNAGGPGNPFGRRLAELRRIVLSAVTEEQMRRATEILIEKALGGELAALKMLFQYTLGKPHEAVNPDRVDIDEWELTRQTMVPTDVANEIIHNSMPISLGCVAVPNVAEIRAEQAADMMNNPEKYTDDIDDITEEELAEELERQREFMRTPGAYEGLTPAETLDADEAERTAEDADGAEAEDSEEAEQVETSRTVAAPQATSAKKPGKEPGKKPAAPVEPAESPSVNGTNGAAPSRGASLSPRKDAPATPPNMRFGQ
jgi:hypothetical protein